jgi:hypothetical protein
MRTIETEVLISASLGEVWQRLTDFPGMSAWNPFIIAISGSLERGERLDVTVAPPGRAPMSFTPLLLVVAPHQELRWRGMFASQAIFAGEHYFVLSSAPSGTLLTHGEQFSGLLAPLLMSGGMLAATRERFGAMNASLKTKCEKAA